MLMLALCNDRNSAITLDEDICFKKSSNSMGRVVNTTVLRYVGNITNSECIFPFIILNIHLKLLHKVIYLII